MIFIEFSKHSFNIPTNLNFNQIINDYRSNCIVILEVHVLGE